MRCFVKRNWFRVRNISSSLHVSVQSVPLFLCLIFSELSTHLHPTLCSEVVENRTAPQRRGKGKERRSGREGREVGRCVEKEERSGEWRKTVGGSERQSRRRWKECRDTLWCERSVLLQYDSDRLM